MSIGTPLRGGPPGAWKRQPEAQRSRTSQSGLGPDQSWTLGSAADAKPVGDWMVARWSLHNALPARVSTVRLCAYRSRASITRSVPESNRAAEAAARLPLRQEAMLLAWHQRSSVTSLLVLGCAPSAFHTRPSPIRRPHSPGPRRGNRRAHHTTSSHTLIWPDA